MNDEVFGDSLTRAQVDALPGALVLEFGAQSCGHCQRARPAIAAALQRFAGVRHVRIEDGPGRRLVRPVAVEEVDKALQTIAQRA